MDWQDIKFSECAIHNMIRYACAKCPVCQTEEAADLKLRQAEDDMVNLEGIISDLENKIASLEMSRATAAAD